MGKQFRLLLQYCQMFLFWYDGKSCFEEFQHFQWSVFTPNSADWTEVSMIGKVHSIYSTSGLPGKPFNPLLTSLWKAFFFPGTFKNALFKAYICKKISWVRPLRSPPAALRALPYPPLVLRCITSHRFVPSCPTQKYSSEKKKPKITNFWKLWLHVTNPDHKECLWVWAYFNGLILRLKYYFL